MKASVIILSVVGMVAVLLFAVWYAVSMRGTRVSMVSAPAVPSTTSTETATIATSTAVGSTTAAAPATSSPSPAASSAANAVSNMDPLTNVYKNPF